MFFCVICRLFTTVFLEECFMMIESHSHCCCVASICVVCLGKRKFSIIFVSSEECTKINQQYLCTYFYLCFKKNMNAVSILSQPKSSLKTLIFTCCQVQLPNKFLFICAGNASMKRSFPISWKVVTHLQARNPQQQKDYLLSRYLYSIEVARQKKAIPKNSSLL